VVSLEWLPMANRPPHFVIIGAMKCATSTLHDQLAGLRGVFMTDPKEPNFFSDEPVWERGEAWYASLFECATPGDICGESSTHYTKLPTHPHAAERLWRYAPYARIVYVMRDPIDRLVSHYIHAWSRRELSVPIDEAVETNPELIDYSRYAMQLEPWIERFGVANVLPVFFERLTARPQPEFERICRFIGYDGTAVWERGTDARNVSAERMRRHPALDRVLAVGPLKTLRRTLLPESVRDRIKDRWRMRERPELSEAALASCVARLDPDLHRLGVMLGLELDCERFKQVVTSLPQSPEWAGVAV
jgi:hypothetical protein